MIGITVSTKVGAGENQCERQTQQRCAQTCHDRQEQRINCHPAGSITYETPQAPNVTTEKSRKERRQTVAALYFECAYKDVHDGIENEHADQGHDQADCADHKRVSASFAGLRHGHREHEQQREQAQPCADPHARLACVNEIARQYAFKNARTGSHDCETLKGCPDESRTRNGACHFGTFNRFRYRKLGTERTDERENDGDQPPRPRHYQPQTRGGGIIARPFKRQNAATRHVPRQQSKASQPKGQPEQNGAFHITSSN